ncbi:MAG: SprT-like domain-containing protein [Betaproteobacteria bacterium]|nr:SprT-like domain-containing protein [Betaproteobacteria bacterium]
MDENRAAATRRGPRTFLRTLLHELCHHLDYEMFRLEETFHTEGFQAGSRTCSSSWQARRPGGQECAGRAGDLNRPPGSAGPVLRKPAAA